MWVRSGASVFRPVAPSANGKEGTNMSSIVTLAELDEQQIEMLPSRDTMALINITNIIGVNLAIAVNAASINASANATAMQYLGSWQH